MELPRTERDRRQLAGFQSFKPVLDNLGVSLFAASADHLDKASAVAAELAFPVGYGVTRGTAGALGAWWNEQRNSMEPAEFVVDRQGTVMASSYSSGPLGRFDAAEIVRYVTSREAQAKKT